MSLGKFSMTQEEYDKAYQKNWREEHKEYIREKQREIYYARKAAGICVTCGEKMDNPTHVTCDKCRAYKKTTRWQYKENKTKASMREKAKYQKRKAANLCVRCGKEKEVPTSSKCNSCHEYARAYDKKKRERLIHERN